MFHVIIIVGQIMQEEHFGMRADNMVRMAGSEVELREKLMNWKDRMEANGLEIKSEPHRLK